jgi:2-polyprenyl-6-methoxyphenol hydroxylase-like FAD-dependent oxidoreductase
MERVVIVGASIGGLATALALNDNERQLLIVERDGPPPEIAPGSAFDGWDRKGVPHFRLSHSLLARLPTIMRQHHPEVLDELARAGIEPCPIEFALPSNQVDSHRPQPSDIDLRHLWGRRATFEYVLRRHVGRLPNVQFVHGARVAGLLTTRQDQRVRVCGLHVARGSQRETIEADWVVDASGSRSKCVEQLRGLGAEIEIEAQSSEFTYFCRHYRMRDGGVAPFRRTGAILDYLWFGAFFAEHGHFSLAFACPSAESELVDTIRRGDGFDEVGRSMPGVAALLDRSEVASKVLGAGGLNNRWNHFIARGAPAVLGFFPVGDSHLHTNPMYGRGCAAAFVQARALAEAVKHGDDPTERARRYHAQVWAQLRPQYDFCLSAEQLYAARGRRARGQRIARALQAADYFTDQVWTPAVLESPLIARESVKMMQMQAMSGFWIRLATIYLMLWLWLRRGFRRIGPVPERTGPGRSELLSKLAETEAEAVGEASAEDLAAAERSVA